MMTDTEKIDLYDSIRAAMSVSLNWLSKHNPESRAEEMTCQELRRHLDTAKMVCENAIRQFTNSALEKTKHLE